MAKNDMGKGVVLIGVGAATAAATAAAIALLSRRKATEAPPTGQVVSLDEITMELLVALAQEVGASREELEQILRALQGLSISVQGFPPNADTIRSARTRIDALNTSYQLPYLEVPDGMQLAIVAWPANLGLIYVGGNAGEALNVETIVPLLAGSVAHYYVKNASNLYVSGTAVGDTVVVSAEQRAGRA